MIPRIYLTAAALMYVGLAIYCSVAPQKASDTVHLERIGAGGKSEFLVIYGGLELAMAAIFLLPYTKLLSDRQALWILILIHAILVAFRTASILIYGMPPASTQKLAIGEWVVLLSALLVLWLA